MRSRDAIPPSIKELTDQRGNGAGESGAGMTGTLVNDVHSQLNPTRVRGVVRPDTVAQIQATVRGARARGLAVSIAGGRHAMGGQQFGSDTVLIDMRSMNRVLSFDSQRGEVAVEAGILWPELIDHLLEIQHGQATQWGIIQKQTGADRMSLGGALSANVHGRGLTLRPMISDVTSFTLVDATGEVRECSREQDGELFRLAIGGYGLFGAIASVRLRLSPRRKVQRIVEMLDIDQVMPAFDGRIAEGYLYGDFQFSIDNDASDFLQHGVFSCYQPVDASTPVPEGQKGLSTDEWKTLLYLAHADKARAVEAYADHYLATSGQIYWSDTHQLSDYTDGYHAELDRRLGVTNKATEMITEIYVPRNALPTFMRDVAADFREHGVDVVYGTVRLIERDGESFLAWAREPYACVIFNLHTEHTPAGLHHSAEAFRRLIDLAIGYGGSYYLTYHRFATRQHVEACYPQFREFLALKRQYDPEERFQSDWYRHYKRMFDQ